MDEYLPNSGGKKKLRLQKILKKHKHLEILGSIEFP